jgi:hypothetical protein
LPFLPLFARHVLVQQWVWRQQRLPELAVCALRELQGRWERREQLPFLPFCAMELRSYREQ